MCDPSSCGAECDASDGLFEQNGHPTRSSNHPSFELRASRMYTNCFCSRRNGLQDKCPRTQCQGKTGNGAGNMQSSEYSPQSMKFDNNMMGDNPPSKYYEPVGGEGNKMPPDMAISTNGQFAPQMNTYQDYPGDMSSVPMSQGFQGFPAAGAANGMSFGGGNWGQGAAQQGGYQNYM